MAFGTPFLVPVALLASASAMAQTVSFELFMSGKMIGRAAYKLGPAKHGLKLESHYSFHIGANEGDFMDDFKLDDSYAFIEGTTVDIASQRQLSFLPSKTRTELSVSSFKSGAEPTTFLPIKQNFVILPNYDPGAAQVILLFATTHPTPDNKYSVFLPSAGGPPVDPEAGLAHGRGSRSAAPDATAPTDDSMPPANSSYDAIWVKGKDRPGSLDGKPLAVHTYLLAFGKARWIFFADDANNLLQLNVSALHASYVRTKFKLDPNPPATSPTAPQNPPPPAP